MKQDLSFNTRSICDTPTGPVSATEVLALVAIKRGCTRAGQPGASATMCVVKLNVHPCHSPERAWGRARRRRSVGDNLRCPWAVLYARDQPGTLRCSLDSAKLRVHNATLFTADVASVVVVVASYDVLPLTQRGD